MYYTDRTEQRLVQDSFRGKKIPEHYPAIRNLKQIVNKRKDVAESFFRNQYNAFSGRES